MVLIHEGKASHVLEVNRDITDRRRTETALRASEKKLSAMVDHAVDGLISVDQNGTVEHFNPACERLFGFCADEVIGRNIKMLMPEPYRSKHDDYLAHHRETGKAKIIGIGRELTARRKDGSIFPIELSISAFQWDGVRHFSGIIRDITRRKQAEEKNALLASCVDSSSDAIASKTLEGIITSWNASAEHLFGYSAEEVIGRHIGLIIPPGRLEEETGFIARWRAGEQVRSFETERQKKNGTLVPVALTAWPVPDAMGHISCASLILRDITAQRATEAQLERHTRALEHSNKEMEQFAYAASRDLKAPLRVIDNASKWLEEDLQQHLTGENRQNMQLLRGRVGRMEKLPDDLLDYSRIGRSTDARFGEVVAGDALMENILELLCPSASFTVNVSPNFADIRVCRMPLQQILMNLVSNAIKHHDKKTGHIDAMVEEFDAHYAFALKDDGPGIPTQFHDQIFGMFQTLKPRDQVEGSGMGLAMVRKTIDLFGGTLDLDSGAGRGSIFRFTWPKQKHIKGGDPWA
jgi:PAS domain S-box-containing protein